MLNERFCFCECAVNVVITGLGADYTGLGSFGTADNFGENLVSRKESFLWGLEGREGNIAYECTSSIQHENWYPYRFAANSSHMTWTRLIWGL